MEDVVVRDVAMVRVEMLSETTAWLACYLEGTGVDGDRLTFLATVEEGRLRVEVEERPEGTVTFE